MTILDNMKALAMALLVAALSLSSCQETEPEVSIDNVKVSIGDRKVSYRGATIDVTFNAPLAWTARLDLKSGDDEWAALRDDSISGEAKQNARVRVTFETNKSAQERVADLYVTLEGRDEVCICTLTQAVSGESADAAINKALNTYMHEILTTDYLFADAYNEQDINLDVSYKDFLPTHLLSLGDVNIADGGYYKSGSYFGERFIYTNIVEVEMGTKAVQTAGLGFGPFISTALAPGSTEMGIAPAYVRRGSPAEAAGMRRGDLIFAVNGTQLTTSNYRNFMTGLYQNPSGSFKFDYIRFETDENGRYVWNQYSTEPVLAKPHIYDPVLHASVLGDPDNEAVRIGYLVYESFDLNSQEFLKDVIDQFVEVGITDMILDLRFNAGGAVAQSRWLSGCIAGEANCEKTFTKVIYNDGRQENWTFRHGYTSDVDNLGLPTYLGLNRLYVITSYNTASAAELVINSLRGIDFPVYMIGGQTEGKNVGMTVSEIEQNGRYFQFSPVTFWVRNAKDFGDYPDGIVPDEVVTEIYDNMFPYSIGDWGNKDINIALQWAYCEITGKQRWSSPLNTTSSVSSPVPAEFQGMAPEFRRYGNLVYDVNNN